MTADEPVLERAIDNDVVLKAVSYGLVAESWPSDGSLVRSGVLGAARYVVGRQLRRGRLVKDASVALANLESFLSKVATLEPDNAELALATAIELAAQRHNVALDAGESQLVAMVITRGIDWLETGDKRAIEGLETLIDVMPGLRAISGRVVCLEQVVRRSLEDLADCTRLGAAICAEPDVDKTLTICFACHSGSSASLESVLEGLESYVASLRRVARRVLCP